jgi:lipopolysaccharide/colanic/teichoic acid biosynthesis glycosyltransferase
VGRVLRRLSIDELPQLFNVLRGDMSLVGPRPVPVYEVAGYERHHFGRLAAAPGVTGLAQVRGRGTLSFEDMVALDLSWVATKRLSTDLGLLLRTVPAVARGLGAN